MYSALFGYSDPFMGITPILVAQVACLKFVDPLRFRPLFFLPDVFLE